MSFFGEIRRASAVSGAINAIDIFILGSHSHLLHTSMDSGGNFRPKGRFHAFTSKGFLHGPVAVSRGPGLVDVFLVGFDSQLYYVSFKDRIPDGGPIDFTGLGGILLGPPTVVARSRRIDIFAIGTDHQLYHKILKDNNSNSDLEDKKAWKPLGGVWVRCPGAVHIGGDRVDVCTVGRDFKIKRRRIIDEASKKEENEEENEEGQVIRRPALWAPGDQWPNHRRMGILAVGIDSSYHYQWYDDADSPHAWRPVGGTWQLEPEVVTLSHDKVPLIAIFGLAIDSTLQWKFWDGGNPTGVLDSLGGRWLGPPTVVTKQGSAGPQSAWDLFIVGWDLKLYHVQGSFIWQATPPGHGRGAGAPGGGAFVPRWGSFEPLGGLTE